MSALVTQSRRALTDALIGLLAEEPAAEEPLDSWSKRIADGLLASGVVRVSSGGAA